MPIVETQEIVKLDFSKLDGWMQTKEAEDILRVAREEADNLFRSFRQAEQASAELLHRHMNI